MTSVEAEEHEIPLQKKLEELQRELDIMGKKCETLQVLRCFPLQCDSLKRSN